MTSFFKQCLLPVLAAAAFALPTLASSDDGRTGPVTFDGAALDTAMMELNMHLRLRAMQDEMLANLDAVPERDFVQVAKAVTEAPFEPQPFAPPRTGLSASGAGTFGGRLVPISYTFERRGSDYYMRIVPAAVRKMPGYHVVAVDALTGYGEVPGAIVNDPTLDHQMRALSRGLLEFELRRARIGQAVPAITGASFDNYGAALKLLF